jgi:hypothetical protein
LCFYFRHYAKPQTVTSKRIGRHNNNKTTDINKKKKQTILTGDQRHRNDITNGQRVGRHLLPTLLCFIFFPTAQNILKFYANPQMAHLVLPNAQADPSQNQKSHFLPPHQMTIMGIKNLN